MRRCTTHSLGVIALLPILCMIGIKLVTIHSANLGHVGTKSNSVYAMQGWEYAHAIQGGVQTQKTNDEEHAQRTAANVRASGVDRESGLGGTLPRTLFDIEINSARNLRSHRNHPLTDLRTVHRMALPLALSCFLVTLCGWMLVD